MWPTLEPNPVAHSVAYPVTYPIAYLMASSMAYWCVHHTVTVVYIK